MLRFNPVHRRFLGGVFSGFAAAGRRLRRLGRTRVFRLTLLLVIGFNAVVGASLASVYWLSIQYMAEQVDANVLDELKRLELDRGEGDDEGLTSQIETRAAQANTAGHYFLLTNKNQQVIAGNLRQWPAGVACGAASNAGVSSGVQQSVFTLRLPAEDVETTVRVASKRLPDGRCLLVGQAMLAEEQVSDHIGHLLMVALGVITLFSLLGGAWVGASVLRRVDVITLTARQIMAGEFSRRIPSAGSADEFTELSSQLNQMLDRIDALMSGMRQVTDNIAHDLRSPLTRMRNRLDIALHQDRPAAAYRELMQQTLDDAEQLLGLFNTLIAIAQAESGVRREAFTPVDFSGLLSDLVELYHAAAEDQGIALRAEIQPGITRAASRGLLTQSIVNVLENALHYGAAGAEIFVQLRQSPSAITLCIADQGAGIPNPDDRLRVLERFVRLDASRSSPGSGLGLALVRAAMHEQGGSVVLEDNQPGLRVVLTFPLDNR